MSTQKKYRQIMTPDFSRIAAIIINAKGVDRSMAQFSEVTGINTSTLSRLINGKMKRPLTIEVIEAIMDNKCAACEITKEEMYRANGMISTDTNEQIYRDDHQYDRFSVQHERLVDMRSVLLNELFNRGIAYRRASQEETKRDSVLADFSTTDSRMLLKVPDSNHETYWCITLNTAILPSDDRGLVKNEESDSFSKAISDRLLCYYALYFLRDAWEPETLKEIRFSFAFCDEAVYASFREGLKKAKITSNMTTILISLTEGKVLKEEPLPGCKRPDQDHFFEKAVEENTEPPEWDYVIHGFDE